jgi:hypothetical protein
MIRLKNGNRATILPLTARRKGIARCAALHLDCARSAERGAYRFALQKQFCAQLTLACRGSLPFW